MFYTVIQKSGWSNSPWRVARTFDDAKTAEGYAQGKHQPSAREDFYHVEIKKHKKPLADLTNFDNLLVKFSDGTLAEWGI